MFLGLSYYHLVTQRGPIGAQGLRVMVKGGKTSCYTLKL
jgi:hypothetical protein